MNAAYVELHCHSAFSLLDGVSTIPELVARAAELDMPALALTDHDALYGAVPFAEAAREAGIQPIFGAEVTMDDGAHLTLLVEDAAGWRNLCRLISAGRAQAPKGKAAVPWPMLAEHSAGLFCLSGCRRGPVAAALLRWDRQAAFRAARSLQALFPDRFAIEVQHHLRPDDGMLVDDLLRLAGYLRLPAVVTNNVHYARRSGQRLHDTLIAIRRRQSLDAADPALRPNDEFYLKPFQRLAPLFPTAPAALRTSLAIAERCRFRLQFGLQDLPRFPTPPGCDALGMLHRLCLAALPRRYGESAPAMVEQVQAELALVARAGLANYLLIVWDLVRFARSQGIRCQGRGSAANSLLAYLLDISPVDPRRHRLVVERFLSAERPVLPDIDLDVDAQRREEVIQYLYTRYGHEHVALACTFITFQARSALADVARALAIDPDRLPQDPTPDSVQSLLAELCAQIHGLPRHLGQHSGGMVLMREPLSSRLPSEPTAMPGRTVTQWDKDALETAGIVKIDVLGLRMLSAISSCLEMLRRQGQAPDLEALSYDDPAIYRMLSAGDTLGVFQVESRAQTSVLPRLQPACFDDIVVAVSLIRPGPLQGQMVHPYLRRRAGLDPVSYLHPCLEPVLDDTLGVLLFQEQVLLVVEAVTGWSRGRGELVRRTLAKADAAACATLRGAFVAAAQDRGMSPASAGQIFEQLQNFAGYSFPRSHAAAFAVLVYQSAWLKRYAPAAFVTALLNHQPMGFWPPGVLIGDAKRHGVRFANVDVQRSIWGCALEGNCVRLGLRYVGGLGAVQADRITAARPFNDLRAFCRRTRLPRPLIERLILAGALDSLGEPRRALLWRLGNLRYEADALDLDSPLPEVDLEPLTAWDLQCQEEAVLGLNVGDHLLAPWRRLLRTQGVRSSQALREAADGSRVVAVGQRIVHQAPPSAKGHQFVTLEDEAGLIDVVLRPSVAARSAAVLASSRFLQVTGMLQRSGGAPTILAWAVAPWVPQP